MLSCEALLILMCALDSHKGLSLCLCSAGTIMRWMSFRSASAQGSLLAIISRRILPLKAGTWEALTFTKQI